MQHVIYGHKNKVEKLEIKCQDNNDVGILEIEGVSYSVDWPVFQFICQLLDERGE